MFMKIPKQAKGIVIPFPVKGAFTNSKRHGKRHWTINGEFSEKVATEFARALLQDNLEAVSAMIDEHGQDLATIRSNFFCLPLLIAAKYDNTDMINLLLANGACPYLAINDPRFEYVNAKTQSYLKNAYQFGQNIQDSL